MLFPKRPDWKKVNETTIPVAGGETYSLRLSREFWLENIILNFSITTNGEGEHITDFGPDGLLALCKKIELSITDATGNRKVIDASGPQLVYWWKQITGGMDRHTCAALTASTPYSATLANSITYNFFVPIPFRDPRLSDPFGAAMMLPLPRLSVDPELKISLGIGATDVATAAGTWNAGIASINIYALLNRRDVVTPNFPYIPTELIGNAPNSAWPSAGGKGYYDIAALGTVTGILLCDYYSATDGALKNTVGGSVLSHAYNDDYSIEYLSTIIRRIQASMMQAENDYTVPLWPATWPNGAGKYLFDFITDYEGSDASAFSFGSCLDLNPLAASGGKARIIFSSVAAKASPIFARTDFLIHKCFGDLRAIKFA